MIKELSKQTLLQLLQLNIYNNYLPYLHMVLGGFLHALEQIVCLDPFYFEL